ncbi:MAG: DNA internalization-related competence protein ComEC/Rec2, partial [Syntrophomonadaceae bacterium]|nr:DNA internalization-related competence protein ComEC/Rec2 [Syntrophomonadaceae bacterium]
RVEENIRRELPPQQASYLAAVLFGDKSGLPAEELELYQRLGLAHVFSVSGLHLGFVLALSLLLARGLRLKGAGYFLFNLLSMLFYAAMVGFPPATMRALLMAALALGAYLFRREVNPLGGLALAGLVLLIGNPRLLFDAGFQLSFTATGGLVYLYPRLQVLAAGWPRGAQWLLLPLAAQLGILPLVAYYYGLVSPVSLFTNLVLVGLLGSIVMVGILSIPFMWLFPLLGEHLLLSAGALVQLADLLTRLFNAVPGGVWYVGAPSSGLVLLCYAAGVAWGEGWFARIKASGAKTMGAAAGLAAVAVLALLLYLVPSDRLKVVFLDVGQGDSIIIVTPRGRSLLIDGGGRTPEAEGYFDVGSRIVLPYLRREGIGRLDLLVNTHPHDDHLDGLYSLVESVPVEQVLVSAASVDHPKTQSLLSRCSARGIAWSGVKRGDYLELEPGLRLEVLHPGPSLVNPGDENENSLVLRLVYRETAFLFTGDLDGQGMGEILRSGMTLGSQVFKVPHHGSALGLNEEFLGQVGAEVGVISVGSNHFGHPAPEVLRFWQESCRPLFRTDQKGAIIVTSNGKKLWVTTQLKGADDGS